MLLLKPTVWSDSVGVDLYRTQNTIVTVAGDFVAPSSQAAIDKVQKAANNGSCFI
jgi:hypothetical protein